MRDGAHLHQPQTRLRSGEAHRAPREELKMVWNMPVHPAPSEALRQQPLWVRRRKHRPAPGLEDGGNALQQGERRRGVLDDLVERDVVEKAGLIVLRIESADAGLQAVALGYALDVLVHLAAVGVAAARLVIGERLPEAATDVEHPNIARYPPECRGPFPVPPRAPARQFLVRLEIVEREFATRIELGIEASQMAWLELPSGVEVSARAALKHPEQPRVAVAIVVETGELLARRVAADRAGRGLRHSSLVW